MTQDDQTIADIEAESMAQSNEQARVEAIERRAKTDAGIQAGLYDADLRAQSIDQDRRAARAAIFAASPKGRRLLAQRAA